MGLVAGELISLGDGDYILGTIRDITRIKQTEQALAESERRFRALIENSFDVVMMISPDGEVTYVSPSIRRVLGYDPDEFVGLPRTDITHPDDVAESIELFVRIFDQPEKPVQMTHRLRHKDGSYRMIEIVGVNMIDVPGVGAIVSNFRDVTESRQAEARVRYERDFADTVINSLPGIFYVFDVDGGFLRWNENFEKITGYSADELAKMTPIDFFREADQPMIAQRVQEVFEKGISTAQADYLFKDGNSAPFFFTGIRFESEGRPMLIGIGIDISEQHAAEAALRQYAKRLEVVGDIIQSVLEARSTKQIATAVLERIDDLVPCNRSSVVLFEDQLERATLLAVYGDPDTQMRPGMEVPLDMFGDIESLRKGEIYQLNDLEHAATRSAVQQTLFDEGVRAYASVPLLAEGDLVGILNIGADEPNRFTDEHGSIVLEVTKPLAVGIRQSQLHEQVLRHTEELEDRVSERTAELATAKERAESADRVKSAFLATMSHELRTPLNSIIGFTGIMTKGLTGPLNDEQTKQLGMVQGSARHLLSLINDVLDISKIEAGQFEIISKPFHLGETIEKAVKTVMPAAEQKSLRLRTNVGPNVGEVVGDQRRVEQILLNLINNAIKFTESGEVSVACELSNGTVVTSVADTGSGIKPDDLDKLFQPFQQLDSGIARQHEGTGLGLAICKRLVNLMGGEISVESTWSEGSTFKFTFPLSAAAGGNPAPARNTIV